MNQIVLMGRLTRDPELRHTQSGTPVASFSLAVDRGYASKDSGERQTDFIDIVAWRGTGEFVSKYFTKGQMAAVTGRLQIRDWTDKDGNKRRSAEVIADNIYFTESKRSRDAATAAGGAYAPPGTFAEPKPADYSAGYASPVAPSEFSELEEDDGDLPF
ncbi:MAG: single-stranded DNA-binding protein [Oscillospiraceae bacterium]|jgi:single-strand DNA-binding protein|nr:single-stranded DNA-binding protein [Oscillospiraceae bacterium]